MPRRLRATLRGIWWTTHVDKIRHCFVCGGRLAPRFVPADKKKRLVCVDCLHITYLNPKSVAGLIPVMPDGRIALLQRDIEPAKGRWTYPAGYQEIGESVEEAAVRETREEICVKAKVSKLLGIYSYADAGVITTVYVGRVSKGEKPAAGSETANVQLFRRNEIPWKDLAFRSTVDALKDWVAIK
jgi:ADP-ribose pyrophosphatase YjhB (NUDIX family)